ncbi:unnamed protein product [Phytophthora fragariaefolia]|uniref:Unnamed protein product n=1 Tax=Phytophthora fragariaefolia TaxID=1490495 RepID=A0A9W6U4Z1_9STRA|nr:unnamed protein product [Phytophthora fragariaefolia]
MLYRVLQTQLLQVTTGDFVEEVYTTCSPDTYGVYPHTDFMMIAGIFTRVANAAESGRDLDRAKAHRVSKMDADSRGVSQEAAAPMQGVLHS